MNLCWWVDMRGKYVYHTYYDDPPYQRRSYKGIHYLRCSNKQKKRGLCLVHLGIWRMKLEELRRKINE